MFLRSVFIPIALFQLLPCKGEDVFSGFSGTDDFANFPAGADWDDDFGSFIFEAMSDSGLEQCLEGFDLLEFMQNPFATVADDCNPTDEKKFNDALDAFETCSHFDLNLLIETFASAVLGLGLNCGSYFVEAANAMDIMMVTGNLDLPRVPDICVDALVGDNPFGNMMLAFNAFPKQEMGCFYDLAEALPLCTLKEWPIPIVGNWLKSISCIVGSMDTTVQPMIDTIIQSELAQLTDCLPAKISEENCQEVIDSCLQVEPIISIYMPAPFNAAPLSDTFQDAAEKAGIDKLRFEGTLKLYEDFRKYCTSAKDRAIFERVPSKSATMNALLTIQKAGSVGGSSSKFFPGFFTGSLLACVGFFLYSKKRGGNNKPYNNIELNSLELRTENQFT